MYSVARNDSIFFATVCWGGGIRSSGVNTLNKFVRKKSSVMGMELGSVEVVTERRRGAKIRFGQKKILKEPTHILRKQLKTF